jgi:hypothetical protein
MRNIIGLILMGIALAFAGTMYLVCLAGNEIKKGLYFIVHEE